MGSYPDEFPFGIMEVVNLLNLRIRRQQANSVYVDSTYHPRQHPKWTARSAVTAGDG